MYSGIGVFQCAAHTRFLKIPPIEIYLSIASVVTIGVSVPNYRYLQPNEAVDDLPLHLNFPT